jgi:hypothetical protein
LEQENGSSSIANLIYVANNMAGQAKHEQLTSEGNGGGEEEEEEEEEEEPDSAENEVDQLVVERKS